MGELIISNNGNLIRVIRGQMRSYHEMVFNTTGMGDRRQRKRVAKARRDELEPPPPLDPRTCIVWSTPGIIRSINVMLTLKV